ncbi:MAG: DUF3299 domain-containing protein [Spirochaetales bacterium]|nr:DUF3299 domain-containing protein [Leptospiraceae bacterium]MCP5480494.1 DUF3299 domain-containing protein [Spirochaetales bacterium]
MFGITLVKLSFRTILWTVAIAGILAIIPYLYLPSGPDERFTGPIDEGTAVVPAPRTAAELQAEDGVTTLRWENLAQLNYQTGNAGPMAPMNGKRVRIGGFMVPLEDELYSVTEFLLVPYPQACIHVPAPPPNQIVHVIMAGGSRAEVAYYAPIWVYGRLRIENRANIYAEASYVLSGERTEPYTGTYE